MKEIKERYGAIIEANIKYKYNNRKLINILQKFNGDILLGSYTIFKNYFENLIILDQLYIKIINEIDVLTHIVN